MLERKGKKEEREKREGVFGKYGNEIGKEYKGSD